MPLTISRTWQFSNQAVGAQGTLLAQNQRMMRLIKAAMVGFGTLPWTVQRSSNSVVANTSDNWTADADLVWANAGSVHSWIVLQQGGIGTGFQICIDLSISGVNGNQLTLVVSPSAGFTGGTTSNRPTATDQATLYTAQAWSYNPAAAAQQLMVMQSTDGQCTRVMIFKSSVGPAIWILDKAQGLPSSLSTWAPPFVAWILGTGGGDFNAGTLVNTLQTATGKLVTPSPAIVGSVFLGAEGGAGALISTTAVANEASSEWPLAPCALVSETAGARGRWGYLADCWLGANATIATGDVYPSGVSRLLIQSGIMVLPWDGSVPPTGGTARDGDTFLGTDVATQASLIPYAVVNGSMQILGALATVMKNEAI